MRTLSAPDHAEACPSGGFSEGPALRVRSGVFWVLLGHSEGRASARPPTRHANSLQDSAKACPVTGIFRNAGLRGSV